MEECGGMTGAVAAALVKDILRAALYYSGTLACWHYWRNRRALTVLMFHRVLPADDPAFGLAEHEFAFTLEGFRRTLDFVRRHYNVVSLDDLEASRQGRASLPRTPLLITFDDGWRDALKSAVPELRRRNLPAVLFVPSEIVSLDDRRWWQDALSAVLRQPGAATRLCKDAGWVDMPPGGVNHALAAHLAAMRPASRRDWIERYAPGVLSQVPQRQMVNLGELKVVRGPALAVGGHGHTHGPLTLVPDPKAELQASQRLLDELGQEVRSMSFPHGAWSKSLVDDARATGFDWIFTSQAELVDVSRWSRLPSALGRIHLSENAWTCKGGHIDPARLATFLFFRPIQHG